MFSHMLDDALCIDVDAEYALLDSPQFDPSFGTGDTLTAALAHEADVTSNDYDTAFLAVGSYA